MKSFQSLPKSRLNLIVYLVIILLLIPFSLMFWTILNQLVIRSGNLTEIPLDRSMIRMKKDVYLNLNIDLLKSDNNLYQKVQRNVMLYKAINSIFILGVIILVLLQLKSLIASLKEKSFFISKNFRCVRRISYLLTCWVWIDIILYLCIPLFIPHSVIRDGYNYWPINGDSFNITVGILTLLLSINYGVLLSAFAFYIISIVFKEGSELKEQVDLTI
jgi:hypothetical protein